MFQSIDDVPIILRRQIEASIVGPILTNLVNNLGEQKAFSLITPVIENLAVESGIDAAKRVGGDSIEHFSSALNSWSKEDAIDSEIIEQSDKKLKWIVHRCAYAKMYEELGLKSFGYVLSCSRDFAMVKGFNKDMVLKRDKTIMEGYKACDFEITMP